MLCCRVLAVLTAQVSAPFPDRPTEGLLTLNVEIPAMAGPGYEGGRPSEAAVELGRLLERQIRDARAIDVEALCITPGEAVWALRCDVRVLDDGGNLPDAVALAAIGAFLHFRRADVSVEGDRVVVHSYASRAPVPLSIHHIPVCVTFGLVSRPLTRLSTEAAARRRAAAGSASSSSSSDSDAGMTEEVVFLDPHGREERVCDGRVTFVVNAHRELCGVHKLGGCPLAPAAMLQCARVAGEKAVELVGQLKTALAAAEKTAAEKARARHAAAAGFGAPDALTAATAPSAAAPGHARAARAGAASETVRKLLVVSPEEDAAAGDMRLESGGDDSDSDDAAAEEGDVDMAAAAGSVAAVVQSSLARLGGTSAVTAVVVSGGGKGRRKGASSSAGAGADEYAAASGAIAGGEVVTELDYARREGGGGGAGDAPLDEKVVFGNRGAGQPG